MKIKIIDICIMGLLLLRLLTGCNKEYGRDDALRTDNNYLAIEGENVGTNLSTRALTDVLGSCRSFEVGDEIGFYSFHENGCNMSRNDHFAAGDPVEYMRNVRLTYSDIAGTKKFISTEIENVVMNTLGLTFAYYPYSDEEMPEDGYVKQNGANYEPLGKHDHYIHIFDSNNQVKDLLTATKRQYSNVNYMFGHQFSMVLLFLGDGFSPEQNEESLTVYLTEHIIGAHVTREWRESVPPDRFTFTVDRIPLDYSLDIGYSSFKAFKRGEYILPGTTESRIAYSVILPYGTEIDYIQVMDKNGNLQKVKATTLPELESGWIYPATIRMSDGLVPTLYPHEIIPWGDPIEIKVDKLPGIYSSEEFEKWLGLYNKNVDVLHTITGADFTELEKYGTYDAGEGWIFYIRDSIDCSRIESTTGTLITKLVDGVTIDGGRHQIKNIMLDLKGEEPIVGMGLIGEITGGRLWNLRLYFPTVRYQGVKPSGCIAAVISGGQITNCTVREAAMLCRETVGVLVGEITDGAVDDCKFHGVVQAAVPAGLVPEYLGVVGKWSGGTFGTIINSVKFIELESDFNQKGE